jgi:tRNA 2-thiocytidine biosynthesis protein TtcA
MIADGDRILVGVSGGKDSLTLLWSLTERLTRIPIRYTLLPVYIDPGFPGGYETELRAFVSKMGLSLHTVKTDFGPRAHGPENRENPCFLCSRLRRKRFFEIADQNRCRKIALGHTRDDIIETFFINLFYGGKIETMAPAQSFFDGRFTLIRPLSYTDEDLVSRFTQKCAFPVFHNPCPSAGTSKRKEIKDLLAGLYQANRKVKGNIFRALHHGKSGPLL